MAQGLHHEADMKKFIARAENWKKLWDAEAVDHTEAGEVKGFIWIRHDDGRWKENFDPHLVGTWYQDNFYEGTTWTYSLYVPQDARGLIQIAGGETAFGKRLDLFLPQKRLTATVTTSETSPVSWLPTYITGSAIRAGRRKQFVQFFLRATTPVSTVYQGMTIQERWDRFLPSIKWASSQSQRRIYLIGSPTFPRSSISLANGKTFSVIAENSSPTNIYIAKATWNGKLYQRSWFTHDQLMAGGELRLTMTDKPTHWDTGSIPPSMSDEKIEK